MSDVNGKEITMPQLAESLVQATIGKWLKQPGESFEAYEPICEVITDKVVAELPATEAGVMEQIIAQEGETVDVGAVICRVRTDAAGFRQAQSRRTNLPPRRAIPRRKLPPGKI